MSDHRRSVVAMVSDAIYPYHRGGKEVRYHELAQRLAKRAEVHVYTMQWWKGSRERTEDAVTFHAISRLHGLYVKDRRPVRQAIFFAIACFRLLKSRFDVLEADHIPYFQVILLRIVATLKRKRLVVMWHEVWGRSYRRQYLGRAWPSGLDDRIASYAPAGPHHRCIAANCGKASPARRIPRGNHCGAERD